jgi:hypothetical protein
MLRRLSGHLAKNAVAYLALFVAFGGTSVAAVSLGRNSVKTRNISPSAVTGAKVKDRSLRAVDFGANQLPAGARGAACSGADPACRGPRGEAGAQGDPGARGDVGQRGEQGLQGEQGQQGEQGPGAQKIAWEAVPYSYGNVLAVVGPWTVSADCDGQGGTGVYLYVNGPGTAEYHVARSTSDAGPSVPIAKGVALPTVVDDFSGAAPGGAYRRSAGTMILQSGGTVAQVELRVLGDSRAGTPPGGECSVHGTAIPAA